MEVAKLKKLLAQNIKAAALIKTLVYLQSSHLIVNYENEDFVGEQTQIECQVSTLN